MMPTFTKPSVRTLELAGAALIFLILLGMSIWYMATHQAPRPSALPGIAATSTPAQVALPPQSIEEHATYYDIETSYPAQTSLKATAGTKTDAAAVASMKSFIESTIADFKREGNFANLSHDDIQMMGLDQRKESLVIEFKEQSGAGTISYLYSIYLDTLGAHPNAFYRTFVFDAKTGSELTLGNLFLPKTAYLARLSALSREKLMASLGEMADADYIKDGTKPETDSFQSFSIDGANLVLTFPPYQVAPYAAGTQTVSIPFADLADILKPAYR